MRARYLMLLLLLFFGNVTASYSQQPPRSEKVIETGKLTGKFIGFEAGDYLHAVIEVIGGKKQSFFLAEPGLDYFLALHREDLMEFTFQVVETHIPEAGGVQTIERLRSAKSGALSFEAWWKREKAKSTMGRIRRKYEPLVQKSIIKR